MICSQVSRNVLSGVKNSNDLQFLLVNSIEKDMAGNGSAVYVGG